MKSFNLFMFGIFVMSCSTRSQSISTECEKFYSLYQETLMRAENDTAEFYLIKAFECDTLNLQYGIELYSLKLQNGKKAEALGVLRNLKKISSAIELSVAEELLIYDIDGKLDTIRLSTYHKQYFSKLTGNQIQESDIFYFVALTNFLVGSNLALSQLDDYENKVANSSGLLSILREMIIEKKDSLVVLRMVFNVQ